MVKTVTVKSGPVDLADLRPGELQQFGKYGSRWFFGCPRCGRNQVLLGHDVAVGNGLVTISPTVGCPFCGMHILVQDGQITWLPDLWMPLAMAG